MNTNEFEKQLSAMSPFEIKGTLIDMAEKNARRSTHTFLNAGRGNPNWILTYPRRAFFLLGEFAMEEAELKPYVAEWGIVASPEQEGIAERFRDFLNRHRDEVGAKVLRHFFTHVTQDLGADPDEFVFELVDGITGDHYPTPPRILKYTEKITQEYLRWAMGGGNDMTEYDLFATEGSTAGMVYMFNSLKANFLMKPGDKIALLTPCFTPYLEIPKLKEYDLDIVYVSANDVGENGYHDWQYPPEEIDKLRDPAVKCVCITNPSNPPSVALSKQVLEQLVDVVKNDNPHLMIITDDVYGTFIEGFKSLMYVLPYNTICLYSYSKYFGATGWRVAAMALRPDNVFDYRLTQLSDEEKKQLNERYSSLTLEPEKLKFIDRLVADSRAVALNHTAGLSTPQQIQMALFSAFAYLHHSDIQPKLIQMIHKRLENLWSTTGFTLRPDPNRAGYYSEIDMMVWAKKFYGEEFADYMQKTYQPLDFVIRLAKQTAIVLLNGDGFDGPEWSVRASLANLNDTDYLKIGAAIRQILDEYHQDYLKAKETK
ncbi:MAG: bifunctional aspartate transaminase/aspartate 4-decarboxylase [Bacteroidales bacterium]|nr:bifunctional aspartate transaminase/aspartate 4-decarboxylase [Bacteroidales bacterium]MBD5293519.1 bifunctional aspartate transaminase/aspartate 4-decarboxylase [Bacteroides sp.]MBD5352467.1 bifunctional aspartate transaminase/aspartate 4-decarboxylase [Bacteroides sp.]MBD5359182.1 bifunctional aspartate transaminase/aspartate 4-decarboxylase [Bacteroides sp.]MBD5362236.1 bifunctional aspartate transaminase/aspartate 4-decarboxylase [Bacteroides sp.]